MLSSNTARIQRFYSDQCLHYYRSTRQDIDSSANGSDLRVRPWETRETAVCHISREASAAVKLVVTVPQLNIVYIENRKAGSTLIRDLLHRSYNATWSRCDVHDRPHCKFLARCTSKCLSNEEMNTLFAFSFVRDDISRFYSALSEHMILHKRIPSKVRDAVNSRKTEAGVAAIESVLSTYMPIASANKSQCFGDLHLTTQAFQLNAPVGKQGIYTLPIRFLGRVENMLDDFIEMLLTANVSNTSAKGKLSSKHIERVVAMYNISSRNELQTPFYQALKRLRNDHLDQLIRLAYPQDMACIAPAPPISATSNATNATLFLDKPLKESWHIEPPSLPAPHLLSSSSPPLYHLQPSVGRHHNWPLASVLPPTTAHSLWEELEHVQMRLELLQLSMLLHGLDPNSTAQPTK
mmetsp:Transcript_22546/g.56022  ORF Transcript_22546/g.56022 Transcript_22546/m.56022 type:complete len:408 (-) Transcript_22546:126-1349(-)